MSDNSSWFIILIILFLLCSAWFSSTETAFSCLNRTRLRALAEQGDKRAEKTLRLVDNYNKMLTTILVGNNVVNIAMASVGTLLFLRYFPKNGASISTLVITVLVLIFGEVSPKTLAREHPERFAMRATPVLRVLVVILTPINFLFSRWQNLQRRIFHSNEEKAMTQDELSLLVEEVAEEGNIDKDERDLLRNALAFEGQDAENILTPRVDMVAVSADASNAEAAHLFATYQFSRLPVYEGSVDHIVGILYQKDFYTETGISDQPIRALMQEPVFVPNMIKIDDLLQIFRRKKSHIAIVSDEFGGTMGMVTMEDVLEELVGEIWDEYDVQMEIVRESGENTYRIMGSADIDQLEKVLGQRLTTESSSAAGWLTEQMGYIPDEGDSFRQGDFLFTVLKADGNRILEIEVRREPEE